MIRTRKSIRRIGAKRPADPVGWQRAGNEQMTVLPEAKKSSVNAVARQSEGRAFDSTPPCEAGFHTQYERREARHLMSPPKAELDELKQVLTQGEREIVAFFDRNLSDNRETYIQPYSDVNSFSVQGLSSKTVQLVRRDDITPYREISGITILKQIAS